MPFNDEIAPPRGGWYMLDEIDLVPLVAEHGRWCRLCARLEAMADALPALPSLIEFAALRCALRDTFVHTEPDCAMGLLERIGARSAALLGHHLVDQLRERRSEVVVRTDDLADMIASRPEGCVAPETLGYMLRGVFEGYRQLIDLELLAILVLASDRLTAGAAALLLERFADKT